LGQEGEGVGVAGFRRGHFEGDEVMIGE
jgi:hypothetical protein